MNRSFSLYSEFRHGNGPGLSRRTGPGTVVSVTVRADG